MTRQLNTTWLVSAILACGCVADITWSASTHPFTLSADLATAGGFALLFTVVGAQRLYTPIPSVLGRRAVEKSVQPRSTRRWRPWAAVLVMTVTFELVNLFASPRSSHPTLSSILDMADAHSAGKATAFAAWLALGWFFITR